MTNILEIGNVRYENGIIKLRINVLKRAVNESVNIWVAEYDESGALVGLKNHPETVTQSKDVEIEYEKSESADETKLFVWNISNSPYCAAQYVE